MTTFTWDSLQTPFDWTDPNDWFVGTINPAGPPGTGDTAIVGDDERNRFADIASFVLDQADRLGVELHRSGRQRERDAVAGQERAQVGIK